MEFELTPSQLATRNLIEYAGNNVLLLGRPGVGKSVLIKGIVEMCEGAYYTLSAPTGLAALNIGGKTLHSIFRIPINGVLQPDYNQFTTDEKAINNIRYNVRRLIIDEISMVRADVFDFIDRMLKEVKGNNLPFGGIQVICVGDFFQLPPVVVTHEKAEMQKYWESPFVFDSVAFKEGNFKVIELTEVLRQKGDNKFLKILDHARTGALSTTDLTSLNKHVGPCEDFRIRLTCINKQADEVNIRELNKLTTPSVTFQATSYGEWQELPVADRLELKVGAQVLVKKNGADKPPGERKYISRVVNGTIGKIVDIKDKMPTTEDSETFIPHILVELEDGTTAKIYRQYWEKRIKTKGPDGQWEEKVVATFEQIPLALAWAISVHKSQGQSFSKVHIDGSKVFTSGQLYVALSRSRSQDGILFAGPINARMCWADRRVLRFHESIEEQVI